MTSIAVPQSLSLENQKKFLELAAQLAAIGVDPAARLDMLTDYLVLGDRVARLQAEEARAAGRQLDRLSRTINNMTVERRRQHLALFGRPQDVDPPPSPAEREAVSRQSEADAAWRAFHWRGVGTEAELRARHGEPSWNSLLYQDAAEQAEAEAAIREFDR